MRVKCARERPFVEEVQVTVQRVLSTIYFRNTSSPPTVPNMPAVQFVVEGGRPLSGSIRPSGNKNAALPIVAAALISQSKVHLENVPRIRDIETLVELIRSVGASMEWVARD
jgi:hypothetical protein